MLNKTIAHTAMVFLCPTITTGEFSHSSLLDHGFYRVTCLAKLLCAAALCNVYSFACPLVAVD